MVGLVCATFRGDVAPDAIQTALAPARIHGVPMAPSCALILRRAFYDTYERRRKAEGAADRHSVHFPKEEGAKDTFLAQHILPHVAKCEAAGEFTAFVGALQEYQLCRAPTASAANASAASASAEPGAEAVDTATLLERWATAKQAKDYATSDRLRDELRGRGVNAETESVLYTDGAAVVERAMRMAAEAATATVPLREA